MNVFFLFAMSLHLFSYDFVSFLFIKIMDVMITTSCTKWRRASRL
jgi:hypothetical protein